MALFLFLCSNFSYASMTLTETIYTIPESNVELVFHEEYIRINHFYRKEHIELGFGLIPDLSIWFKFDYLHGEAFDMGQGEVGDLFFKFWYYIGDYAGDILHLGWFTQFRFPTGKNAYSDASWRNLALGNYDLKIGLVAQVDVIEKIFFHFNVFYTFRPARNDDFYGGFYINPVKEETYTNLFGFNPFSENSFLSYRRLENDYITLAGAINTNVIYPVVPYVEFYGSFRPYQGSVDIDDVPIEAAKYDVFLIGVGLRFFFFRHVFLGIYTVVNPLMETQKGYITNVIGFDMSYRF
jgi:hypothetical protein